MYYLTSTRCCAKLRSAHCNQRRGLRRRRERRKERGKERKENRGGRRKRQVMRESRDSRNRVQSKAEGIWKRAERTKEK